ncbi:murein L,D-transpeptidase catalytic domain family protein [Mucilaginibacter boryungensis]|uniref:Murein L,D-transpeptidase catalytic domain family protein n=1 Tax=Mucilaginibacter boryungensis TaxID=768480 RepID=A0ABR9XGR4_9SPHI|nr:murein L,D-transpeptidase catalytic domain family protein [Mucilaginibacter boryungensis]MBE9666250.1 murein L,D-transpeptidase catalytic domain family protein [Mucilaginibacter boryungensis]
MRKHFLWTICALLGLSVSIISLGFANVAKSDSTLRNTSERKAPNSSAKVLFFHYVDDIYESASLAQAGLDSAVFQKAVVGYYNLKIANKLPANSSILTVVDFNRPSTTKRMWIIDLQNRKLLLNTWVAHGQGSGNNMANAFSNSEESHQSSLGFYITDDIYIGKHGRSLHLDGLDKGFNDRARERSIVLHGAEYVNKNTIDQLGRLGRSFGCPAVSTEVVDQVIDTIKNKNVLFIAGNDSNYTSKYLDEDNAAKFAFADSSFNLAKDAFTAN